METEKYLNKRAITDTEFQKLVLTTRTDLMISKKSLDNIFLTDTKKQIMKLEKTGLVETELIKNRKVIKTYNSKVNGSNIKADYQTTLDLDNQSIMAKKIMDLGFKIAEVKLLEFDKKEGEVLIDLNKDTQLSKNFVFKSFKHIKNDTEFSHYSLNFRIQSLELTNLNVINSSMNYLDIFIVSANEFKEIKSLIVNNRLKIQNYSLIYIKESDNFYISGETKQKEKVVVSFNISNIDELPEKLKEKSNAIELTNDITELNKFYDLRAENKKLYTNNKTKRERGIL